MPGRRARRVAGLGAAAGLGAVRISGRWIRRGDRPRSRRGHRSWLRDDGKSGWIAVPRWPRAGPDVRRRGSGARWARNCLEPRTRACAGLGMQPCHRAGPGARTSQGAWPAFRPGPGTWQCPALRTRSGTRPGADGVGLGHRAGRIRRCFQRIRRLPMPLPWRDRLRRPVRADPIIPLGSGRATALRADRRTARCMSRLVGPLRAGRRTGVLRNGPAGRGRIRGEPGTGGGPARVPVAGVIGRVRAILDRRQPRRALRRGVLRPALPGRRPVRLSVLRGRPILIPALRPFATRWQAPDGRAIRRQAPHERALRRLVSHGRATRQASHERALRRQAPHEPAIRRQALRPRALDRRTRLGWPTPTGAQRAQPLLRGVQAPVRFRVA